jgi:hypothetical protein
MAVAPAVIANRADVDKGHFGFGVGSQGRACGQAKGGNGTNKKSFKSSGSHGEYSFRAVNDQGENFCPGPQAHSA